jgi:acetylornithine deacetylase
MTVDRAAVCDRIDAERDRMVDFLRTLVGTPSVTGDEAAVQEHVVEKFESLGLDPDVWEPDADALRDHPGYFETTSFVEHGYEGRPNVAAVREGAGDGRSLGFSGHVDVVPVDAEEWTYDPWGGMVEDGRLYGRGSADMKGGIAAFVHATEMLSEQGVDLAGDLLLQTTIEEEDGGVGGVLSALERGYRPDAAVVPEPWRIPNVGIASAGVMYFRVTVQGKSAHAARGYQGVNAIEKAVSLVDALADLDRARKQRISYQPAVNRDPEAEGNVTNLNVGTIRSGDWPSTVPGEATFECRIGWPPGEERPAVRQQILDAIDAVVADDEWLTKHPPEIEWFGWSTDPHELDTDAEITRVVKRNAETVTGRTGSFIGGDAGLDERFYNRYYGIPTPTMGPSGENIHGADEYVEINSLVETAQALALTAVDWCGTVDND